MHQNYLKTNPNHRVASIDILRGIAICGMILCANIGWNSGLPGWMFHAQVPPPDYTFRPDIAGITWVDLVFPFFLFSLGASLPFSLKRKIESEEPAYRIFLNLLRRWVVLILFSIILGNFLSASSMHTGKQISDIFLITAWAGMFLALGRFRFKKEILNISANISGAVTLILLTMFMEQITGIKFSKEKSDIIIMIMAYMALSGGLVWYITRNSLKIRWIMMLLIIGIKAIASYCPEDIFSTISDTDNIKWIFRWPFMQYLTIVIAGSAIGDLILFRKDRAIQDKPEIYDFPLAALSLATVCLQLWGLYTRHIATDLVISCMAASVFLFFKLKKGHLWSDIISTGYLMMIIGILFDPADGGIRKDPCNISYLLTATGMASIVTGFLILLETRAVARFKILSWCGQNPMAAYTVTNFITLPVISLLGLNSAIGAFTDGSPAAGIAKGIVITAIMVTITAFLSKKKLFWRS